MTLLIVSLFLPSTVSNTVEPATDTLIHASSANGTKPESLPVLAGKGTLKRRPLKSPLSASGTPITVSQSHWGNIGLQNALNSLSGAVLPRKWIGSLGISTDALPSGVLGSIQEKLAEHGQIPVFLSSSEMDGHYHQFCKQVLWKTFHYQFPADASASTFEQGAWKEYVKVNQKFAQTIADAYEPGDTIWINDYHLMLVPAMVRKLLPDAPIGFFLHIPFPSSEIFRCLYVRNQILQGILGADLVGFQTYSFMRHFLMTCTRLLSLESTPKGIQMDNTIVSVGIFPIGINLIALNEKRNVPEVPEMIASLREKYAGKKVVIGRDKNDYVKGVRLKLLAFERFLYLHPEWIGKVVLIQVALSTTEANENECMVSDVVARINSKFGSIEHLPVVYLHQDISFTHYLALLTIADACLITSLRDGMNLTSHEYVVCQQGTYSPLIMSEFAGTYGSFGCALRVNPWDKQEVAEAIHDALTMGEEEKYSRWTELYRNVTVNTAQHFVENFTKETIRVHNELSQNQSSQIPLLDPREVQLDFVLLDDDGTLWKMAGPSFSAENKSMDYIYNLLMDLTSDSRNIVYLMSGKRRDALEYYADIPSLGISAENGSFLKFSDRNAWASMTPEIDVSWKKDVLEIFEYYTDRTPGSYIEQKETSLVWHFGLADQSFGAWQAAECLNHIQNALAASYSIHPLAKKKSVEVMPRNVNKGVAVRRILEHHQGRRHSSHYASTPHASGHSHGQRASMPKNESMDYGDDVPQATSPEAYYISPQPRSVSPIHYSSARRGVIDFILCIGDDRQDEAMFEYLNREDTHGRTHSGISDGITLDPVSPSGISDEESLLNDMLRLPLNLRHKSVWTCTVGVKSSAAKWYVPGITDVLHLLNQLLGSTMGEDI